MIHVTNPRPYQRSETLDYVLRRAEEESIAAIRSPDPRASASHSAMAQAYSAQATVLLGNPPSA
ncbi:MAG TPA: hypothetical protein VNR68_01225 [Sphingomicrobium sp.]|nr:hypothetical protein [Sphingomicrobium sp.]